MVPSRGIHRGDPLSSYLFLICIEGLTALIKSYERRGLVQGIKVARSAPSISHIFFAGDCYIFCKADIESANNVIQMLGILKKPQASRLMLINLLFYSARMFKQPLSMNYVNT